MGIFGGIFESNKSTNKREKFNWIFLTETSQLKEIVELSNHKLVVIFKHSKRCGISSGVLSRFEKATVSKLESVAFYYLDLIQYRNISNQIAKEFNVYHQSPQAIFLKNGVVVQHESHYDIISNLSLDDLM